MCRHTREPTVLFRVSCRPSHLNFDPFHQPCLLRWLTLYCRRLRLAWAGTGEDCRPRTTWRPLALCGQPRFRFSLLCDSLEVSVPRQDVNSKFNPCVCHPHDLGCLHTRRFGTLMSPPPPVAVMPCRTHPPGQRPCCKCRHWNCALILSVFTCVKSLRPSSFSDCFSVSLHVVGLNSLRMISG